MSNWLFKRDLNAETISQFGYVWVEFRPKYWKFMIINFQYFGRNSTQTYPNCDIVSAFKSRLNNQLDITGLTSWFYINHTWLHFLS